MIIFAIDMTSHASLDQRTRGGLRVLMEPTYNKITYTKNPLSLNEQVERLKKRGLIFDDEEKSKNYLYNISYYRLRAYTYPFQKNENDSEHDFIRNDIHFNDIIDLYCFDRRLRTLIFNAIEKIEVAVRTKIIYTYAVSTGDSHWYYDKNLYWKDIESLISEIDSDIRRSNEDFIKHYKMKYNEPSNPPSWMALEVVSFGTLSKLYQSLKLDDKKKQIALDFGIRNVDIMENWLHAISNLRNCCAHHSRIWNRRYMVGIKLPYNTTSPFLDIPSIQKIHDNKLFAIVSCIVYLINIISPTSEFKQNIIKLLNSKPKLLNMKDMGFPENWQNLPIWK